MLTSSSSTVRVSDTDAEECVCVAPMPAQESAAAGAVSRSLRDALVPLCPQKRLRPSSDLIIEEVHAPLSVDGADSSGSDSDSDTESASALSDSDAEGFVSQRPFFSKTCTARFPSTPAATSRSTHSRSVFSTPKLSNSTRTPASARSVQSTLTRKSPYPAIGPSCTLYEQLQILCYNTLGYAEPREHQLESAKAFAEGKDSVVVMATGAGKTACFTLGALTRLGTTLVICPTQSLMFDLLRRLVARCIPALTIADEGASWATSKNIAGRVHAFAVKILLMSPEKFILDMNVRLMLTKLFNCGQLAGMCIDEAHCIALAHELDRPRYAQLSLFRTLYPGLPIMALSGTCTTDQVETVRSSLKMDNPMVFRQSLFRPNLRLEVRVYFRLHRMCMSRLKSPSSLVTEVALFRVCGAW